MTTRIRNTAVVASVPVLLLLTAGAASAHESGADNIPNPGGILSAVGDFVSGILQTVLG